MGEEGARGEGISQMDMMECIGGHGYRVELQADRMPGLTEAMVFTDNYKHTECLGGMRLQFFLTLFTCAPPGTPASFIIKLNFKKIFCSDLSKRMNK